MPTYEYTLDSNYSNLAVDPTPSVVATAFLGFGMMIFYLIFFGVLIVSMWKVYTKAGKPGWTIFIPVYGLIVMLQIAHLPEWYILLMFIPIVNFFVAIYMMIKLAKAFGKSTAFGIGMILFPFIFYPILAFGKSQYIYSGQTPTSEAANPFNQPSLNTPPQPVSTPSSQPAPPIFTPSSETPGSESTISDNNQTPPTQIPTG